MAALALSTSPYTGDGQTVTVPADGTATATITDTYTEANGSLIVHKAIERHAAGQQGEIVIWSPAAGILSRTRDPGGADTASKGYRDLPAGSQCTVLETADGGTGTVARCEQGQWHRVTIPAGAEATVDLTDTYESGALVVNKTITGPAAGSRGHVRIEVSCNGGRQLHPTFEILTGDLPVHFRCPTPMSWPARPPR